MIGVVAVASTGSSEIAVIDFSAEPPSSVMLSPGTDAGYVVDCYGSLLVTGGYTSGNVNVYSIVEPGAPVLSGSVSTGLSSLTAISTDGEYVLAGGTTSPSETAIVLVSIKDVNTPTVKSTYGLWLPSISNVVIRYPKALAVGPDDAAAVYYKHSTTTSSGFSDLVEFALNPPVMGDFDGWNVAITAGPSPEGIFPPIAVCAMKDGYFDTPKTLDNGSTLSSLAIAEVPDGGYYVALGMFNGEFGIITRAENEGNAWNLFQMPKWKSGSVFVKFLNNPAVAPFLALANVTEGNKYYVNLDLFLLEGTDTPGVAKLQIFHPVLKTEVTLGSMENPTLGVTAFEPPPPWWRVIPWPVKIWQRLPEP